MRFLIFFVFIVAVGAFPHHAHAQGYDASCDGDFSDVLEARAWLTAKREVETAETLILKPDSVMEYTCYSGTGTGAWLGSNFSGNYAGATHGSGGTCINMGAIWDFFQCRDFTETDFRTFQELAGADPRTGPNCNEPGRNAAWTAAIAASETTAATPAAGGGMDATVAYLQPISWDNSAGNRCADFEPIPTGVMADNDDEGPNVPYEDKVCPMPSCYFDPVSLAVASDDRCRD